MRRMNGHDMTRGEEGYYYVPSAFVCASSRSLVRLR